jgi:hypothetical protein
MKKKYTLLRNDSVEFLDKDGYHTLFRVKAVRDFGCVKRGDRGGYIEREANLSHDGTAWVGGGAQAYGNALVCDDAIVNGYAKISGNARICGNAAIGEYERVGGNTVLSRPGYPPDDAFIKKGPNKPRTNRRPAPPPTP